VASTLGNEPPRGVIVIVGDTLRRDHLELYEYGRPTAPNLTQMAQEGVLFSDNISQASWTKVSVSSILTSLYPTTHGVDDPGDRISSVATTLAEVYREAGYATLSFASNGFVGQRTNLHQGFEVVFESPSLRSPDDENPSKTARACIDRLLPWIETHREVPFFAFVHVVDPHSPFEPMSPYDEIWADPSQKAAFLERVEKVKKHIQAPFMQGRGLPLLEELTAAGIDPEDFVPYEIDWYDGSIRGMDVEIGRVLQRLRTLGIEEQTVVAFLSDHGEEFLEHGRHWHGNGVYGEMINVPLMIKWPGVLPEGTVVDETVQSIDLMPTLLDLSGLPKPEAAQGASLLPLIAEVAGRETKVPWQPRPAFAERKNAANVVEDWDRDVDSHAIIVDGWKLIHNVRYTGDHPEFELFAHDEDPLDLEDVASEHPDVVERLASQLDDWHQLVTAARLPEDEVAADGMSPEELERLRSLGYIQ
jgi:arylsulfatase A-like enzyme